MLYTCKECGREHDDARYQDYCRECKPWILLIQQLDKPEVVIFAQKYYWIGSEFAARGDRGHSGRLFTIYFKDGRVVKTTNLWDGGPVPERFQDRIRNNAIRVEGSSVAEDRVI